MTSPLPERADHLHLLHPPPTSHLLGCVPLHGGRGDNHPRSVQGHDNRRDRGDTDHDPRCARNGH